jgi:hypothetical protein
MLFLGYLLALVKIHQEITGEASGVTSPLEIFVVFDVIFESHFFFSSFSAC